MDFSILGTVGIRLSLKLPTPDRIRSAEACSLHDKEKELISMSPMRYIVSYPS